MKNEFIPHPTIDRSRGKTGLLLINLGTPNAPNAKEVRLYLREFLSDSRVVEIPKIIWFFILNFIILPIRSPKSAKAYKEIWDYKRSDSPLRLYLNDLARALDDEYDDLIVKGAMRYGQPSLETTMAEMIEDGVDDFLIMPLYPQYCAATVASTYDEIFRILKQYRWQPRIQSLKPYYDDEDYINSICEQLSPYLDNIKEKQAHILCSFHGMPKRTLYKGDPYYCHSMKTARLIKEKLNLSDEQFHCCFQSRFGPEKWLSPSTDDIITELATKNVKEIYIIAPGFSMDCLETLEEINIGYRELFINKGGENFHYIPCLNASDEAIKLYKSLISKNF